MTSCSRVTRMRSPIMLPSSGSRSAAIPSEHSGSPGRISHSARPLVPGRSWADRAATRRASERSPGGCVAISPSIVQAGRSATCACSSSATDRRYPDTRTARASCPARLVPSFSCCRFGELRWTGLATTTTLRRFLDGLSGLALGLLVRLHDGGLDTASLTHGLSVCDSPFTNGG
jgi:hypothetical protein